MKAGERDSIWARLLVAITTPFGTDGSVDLGELRRHAEWLATEGAAGVVVGGSLGEGSSLSEEERRSLVAELAANLPESVPVVSAVGSLTTAGAVRQARDARAAGARGLLVLPPYVYRGDRREVLAHFSAVFGATDLPCMLYNNPLAYGTDVAPEDILELATEHPTLTGVKESTGDVRRVTALRALLGDRVEVAVGLDDAVLEGVRAGARGWVAGLANGLPRESAALWELARRGDANDAVEVYRWFLPLLRMDTGPKFVQQIKLVTSERGFGHPRVRPPRLELTDSEREATRTVLRDALARRPAAASRAVK
jgi:1-pyrroline-4-hydroxy-2-carboxylate deaminase